MKALILDGIVVDVQKEEFEVHSSMSWVDCDDTVIVGWTYDGKDFKTNEIKFTEEEELQKLRSVRNNLLTSSDWTQIPDTSITNAKKEKWKTYRQELRDITKTASSVDDVKWPTKPS